MRKPPIILSGPFVDLDYALKREWLETNGLGGFASSTVVGMNTRRYHGLLTAATKPPAGRIVMLSKLEETVVVGERRYELSVNRYPGTIHPRGYSSLAEFRLDPLPTFTGPERSRNSESSSRKHLRRRIRDERGVHAGTALSDRIPRLPCADTSQRRLNPLLSENRAKLVIRGRGWPSPTRRPFQRRPERA